MVNKENKILLLSQQCPAGSSRILSYNLELCPGLSLGNVDGKCDTTFL